MIAKSKCCNLKSDLREAVIILMHRGKQEEWSRLNIHPRTAYKLYSQFSRASLVI